MQILTEELSTLGSVDKKSVEALRKSLLQFIEVPENMKEIDSTQSLQIHIETPKIRSQPFRRTGKQIGRIGSSSNSPANKKNTNVAKIMCPIKEHAEDRQLVARTAVGRKKIQNAKKTGTTLVNDSKQEGRIDNKKTLKYMRDCALQLRLKYAQSITGASPRLFPSLETSCSVEEDKKSSIVKTRSNTLIYQIEPLTRRLSGNDELLSSGIKLNLLSCEQGGTTEKMKRQRSHTSSEESSSFVANMERLALSKFIK